MTRRGLDRLRSKSDFDATRKDGRKLSTRHFVMVYRNRPEGTSRLGVIVTRRAGGAVVRNRWKRVVREAVRQGGWVKDCRADVVVIIRREVIGKPRPEVREELRTLFSRMAQS